MAELNAIIGTVLRELAQARYMSDIYSRDLSRLYEKDPLLRMFPVPRAEVQEVELSLKFAISDIREIFQNENNLLSRIFSLYIESISQDALKGLKGSAKIRKDYPQWLEFVKKFKKNQNLKADLQTSILSALEENANSLLFDKSKRIFVNEESSPRSSSKKSDSSPSSQPDMQGKLKGVKIPFQTLSSIINPAIYSALLDHPDIQAELGKESYTTKRYSEEFSTKIKRSIGGGIRDQIYGLQNALQEIDLEALFVVDVDATSETLQTLPESAITTLTIKTQVRNYVWSQVDEKEGKTFRKLSPE